MENRMETCKFGRIEARYNVITVGQAGDEEGMDQSGSHGSDHNRITFLYWRELPKCAGA